jgi:type IV pilus assembly protein PilN
MIRINLLTVEKAAPKKGAFKLPSIGDKGGQIAALVVLLGCAGYIAFDYYQLQKEDARLHTELIAARAEKARLQPILQEVQRFESRKAELQQRVTLIEELRRNQVGPVHLLDQISKSLPDRLWLNDLKQTGDDVQMDGKTSSLTALADLVANLENTGYFTRPVEILSSEEEKQGDTDLIKFSVKATFAMPGQKKPPTAPVAAGAAAARRLAQ